MDMWEQRGGDTCTVWVRSGLCLLDMLVGCLKAKPPTEQIEENAPSFMNHLTSVASNLASLTAYSTCALSFDH